MKRFLQNVSGFPNNWPQMIFRGVKHLCWDMVYVLQFWIGKYTMELFSAAEGRTMNIACKVDHESLADNEE